MKVGAPILFTPTNLEARSIIGRFVGWHSRPTGQLTLTYSDGIIRPHHVICFAIPATNTNLNGLFLFCCSFFIFNGSLFVFKLFVAWQRL